MCLMKIHGYFFSHDICGYVVKNYQSHPSSTCQHFTDFRFCSCWRWKRHVAWSSSSIVMVGYFTRNVSKIWSLTCLPKKNFTLHTYMSTPCYPGLTRSIPWLLMPWPLTSPGPQHPRYWLCEIARSLSSMRISTTYVLSVWRNDRNCKTCFYWKI